MNFKTELAKWGYNKGNSIDVEILVNEILPSLFSQQETHYSKEELFKIIDDFCFDWNYNYKGKLSQKEYLKEWFKKNINK